MIKIWGKEGCSQHTISFEFANGHRAEIYIKGEEVEIAVNGGKYSKVDADKTAKILGDISSWD